MHGSTMIYLFVTPVALALGLYFVPLQVGAAEIAGAAPGARGLLALPGWRRDRCTPVSLTAHGPATAGWTAYYPLSDASTRPGRMDLWIIG